MEKEKRGGARKGAGRKKSNMDISATFRISEEANNKLSLYACGKGISKNKAVDRILRNIKIDK